MFSIILIVIFPKNTPNTKYIQNTIIWVIGINGIIEKWKKSDVKTLDDIKRLDDEFKKKSEEKKQVFKNTKSSEPTVKTRFHNINQTFTKYTPEELEKMLQESQKNKFK